MASVVLIGSLKHDRVLEVAAELRQAGHDVHDDWHAAPRDADLVWQKYSQARGQNFRQALRAPHAQMVFREDKYHLDAKKIGVLVLPAGKSAHMELGYLIGLGKPGYILLDGEPETFDVMYNFATDVFYDTNALISALEGK